MQASLPFWRGNPEVWTVSRRLFARLRSLFSALRFLCSSYVQFSYMLSALFHCAVICITECNSCLSRSVRIKFWTLLVSLSFNTNLLDFSLFSCIFLYWVVMSMINDLIISNILLKYFCNPSNCCGEGCALCEIQ